MEKRKHEETDFIQSKKGFQTLSEQIQPDGSEVHKSIKSKRKASRRQRIDKAGKCVENSLGFQKEYQLSDYIYRDDDLSFETINLVKSQLGFSPLNIIAVSATDPITSSPQIIQLYPLNQNELNGKYSISGLQPFPTMFWMSCPILHQKVGDLEQSGFIKVIQDRLLHDPLAKEYQAQMELAHRRYSEERWSLIREEHKPLIMEKHWERALKDVGIAGMRLPFSSAVKCLHTHLAHHLSRPEHDNLIGLWVQERLEADLLLLRSESEEQTQLSPSLALSQSPPSLSSSTSSPSSRFSNEEIKTLKEEEKQQQHQEEVQQEEREQKR